jgi:acylphosphatase
MEEPRKNSRLSATIFGRFVSDAKLAKRYFVSGMVQGVGFRYFTQDVAEKLRISGFVRNLRDGRVEVFAMGGSEQHAEFRAMLERGPRFASISEVREETATPDPQYEGEFIINPSV